VNERRFKPRAFSAGFKQELMQHFSVTLPQGIKGLLIEASTRNRANLQEIKRSEQKERHERSSRLVSRLVSIASARKNNTTPALT